VQDHIYRMYRSIELRPDKFADYLMSSDVGFTSCERLHFQSRQSIGTALNSVTLTAQE